MIYKDILKLLSINVGPRQTILFFLETQVFLLLANKGEREAILLCQKISLDIVLTATLKRILSVHSWMLHNVKNVIEIKMTKS